MKLNIDLGYILKRLIVIGLGFILISQLKSCDVHALTFNPTLTNCGLYYGTNSQVSGSSGTSTFNGLAYRTCTSSDTKFFTSNRFNYQGTGISTGDYIVQFLVKKTNSIVHSPSVMLLSGSDTSGLYSNYSCFINGSDGSSIQYQVTQNGPYNYGSNDYEYYSVYCPHVTIKGGWFQVYIQSSYNANASAFNNLFAISQSFSFTPISDISNAINNQSQQQHQDSQAIQDDINDVNNAINDDDTTSASQNGNSIFDVDENGQSTNSNVSNYGLESVITAPIQILERATDSCSPLSFTIFQKTITLPCGDALFWNRDFSSQSSIFSKGVSGNGLNSTRNTFRAFWNLFFGGAIIFHLLTILYEVCQKAIDPFDDTLYTISDAIDSRSRSSKLTGVEEVDMSNVQRNLNNYSIKKQASQQEAVVLGSVK